MQSNVNYTLFPLFPCSFRSRCRSAAPKRCFSFGAVQLKLDEGRDLKINIFAILNFIYIEDEDIVIITIFCSFAVVYQQDLVVYSLIGSDWLVPISI